MVAYQKVVAAVDPEGGADTVLATAVSLAARYGAELEMLYACEPSVMPLASAPGHTMTENQLREAVFPALKALAEAHGVPTRAIHIVFGHPSDVLHDYTREHGIDLLVMGSHGKRGLRALLGSTASAVLHGATCDVLTVRLSDRE